MVLILEIQDKCCNKIHSKCLKQRIARTCSYLYLWVAYSWQYSWRPHPSTNPLGHILQNLFIDLQGLKATASSKLVSWFHRFRYSLNKILIAHLLLCRYDLQIESTRNGIPPPIISLTINCTTRWINKDFKAAKMKIFVDEGFKPSYNWEIAEVW